MTELSEALNASSGHQVVHKFSSGPSEPREILNRHSITFVFQEMTGRKTSWTFPYQIQEKEESVDDVNGE
jgi:hypothetical protein